MKGWEITRLGDVCEKITVGHVGSMAEQYKESGIPFLRSQNIKPYYLDYSNLVFIDEVFNQKLKKSILHPGDLAIVRTGYPGTAAVIPKSIPLCNCSDLVIVRPSKKIAAQYLCYIFNSFFGHQLVNGRLVGAAQQHFNITAAKVLQLLLPPLPIQKKIAAILSAYDDLIENNKRRIAFLEKMAEEVYREWFVRLRFPGHEGVKIEKGVPEGWEVKKVENAFEFTGGGTPSTDTRSYWESGTINWYSPTDLTSTNALFSFRSKNRITELGLKESSARLFPKYSLLLTSRATIGQISINTTEACTNQGFITCIPNDKANLFFLYFWLKLNKDYFIQISSGSTFLELTKGKFKKLDIMLPPITVMRKYSEIQKPIFGEIEHLLRLDNNLAKTRDRLLSRLMSGKIDVENLDIQFPPSMEVEA
jgi:type I restriction enzyme, S subunit